MLLPYLIICNYKFDQLNKLVQLVVLNMMNSITSALPLKFSLKTLQLQCLIQC